MRALREKTDLELASDVRDVVAALNRVTLAAMARQLTVYLTWKDAGGQSTGQATPAGYVATIHKEL